MLEELYVAELNKTYIFMIRWQLPNKSKAFSASKGLSVCCKLQLPAQPIQSFNSSNNGFALDNMVGYRRWRCWSGSYYWWGRGCLPCQSIGSKRKGRNGVKTQKQKRRNRSIFKGRGQKNYVMEDERTPKILKLWNWRISQFTTVHDDI